MKASDILKQANIAVEEGTAKHGDTKRSFEFIAQLWSVYIGHSMAQRKKVELNSFDVANMMIMVKQARSIYGHSVDNQVDMAGYAALAAMLNPATSLEDDLVKEMEKLNHGGKDDTQIKPVRQ